jgi:hypothetical protein
MWGRHMYSKENANDWLNNKETNKKAKFYYDGMLLRGLINSCLVEDPQERPEFGLIAGEVAVELIKQYCSKKDTFYDAKAVEFIHHYI